MGELGQALGHEGDHGPQDHSFVAGGQADTAAGAAGVPQRPGRVAVLNRCRGDDHVQDQAHHVDGDVPLAAIDLLGGIPAPAGAGNGVGGADGLGIDHRGGGLGVASGGADPGAQRGVQPGQGAFVAPGGEIAVDGLPGREVGEQQPGTSPVLRSACSVAEARGFEPRMGANPNRISSPFVPAKDAVNRLCPPQSAQVSGVVLRKATEAAADRRNASWAINGPSQTLLQPGPPHARERIRRLLGHPSARPEGQPKMTISHHRQETPDDEQWPPGIERWALGVPEFPEGPSRPTTRSSGPARWLQTVPLATLACSAASPKP
jgi:hypothetical protein